MKWPYPFGGSGEARPLYSSNRFKSSLKISLIRLTSWTTVCRVLLVGTQQ